MTNTGATESGEDVVVDQHYRTVARLKASNGWVLTLHEFLIDGEHAWVTANKNIPMNLSKFGGAYNGALIDSAVQEYDLRSGQAALQLGRARAHPARRLTGVAADQRVSVGRLPRQLVDLSVAGKFLVSMRDTWAAYLVDIATGRIDWTLGGKKSSFKLGPRAGFEWQHDVKLAPGSTVSLYDDHCCQLTGGGTYVNPTGPSRALVLKLDERAHTAKLAAQYSRGNDFDAAYMGDAQPLHNGNVLVGWGSEPYVSEYSRSGRLLFEAELPGPNLTYRATLEPWVGRPLTPPLGAARKAPSGAEVYASWNGATEVAAWQVLGVSSGAPMRVLARGVKSGFETALAVPAGYSRFEVRALDARGRALGISQPFALAPS